MGAQRGLHLAQLDALAAHFHLLVDPTEEFQGTVAPVATAIAGAIPAALGIVDEAPGAEFGIVAITAGQAGAADP